MTTRKQIAANRRNAQRSTGPSSATGKAIASANALRHGLLANDHPLLPWENGAEWEVLRANLRETLHPEGEMEAALVEQIALALWRLHRVAHLETGVLAHHYYRVLQERAEWRAKQYEHNEFLDMIPNAKITDPDAHATHAEEARQAGEFLEAISPTIGGALIRDVGGPDALGKLRRYETALENTFYRAHHELLRLQAARSGQTATLPAAVDVAIVSSTHPNIGADALVIERPNPDREDQTDGLPVIDMAG